MATRWAPYNSASLKAIAKSVGNGPNIFHKDNAKAGRVGPHPVEEQGAHGKYGNRCSRMLEGA